MQTIRLLRGRVVVREITEACSFLTLPSPNPRDVKTHRGTVLAMGLPAQVNGHDVPHGFEVGDVVQFHFEFREAARTRPWVDGADAVWLHQPEIDAVIEDEDGHGAEGEGRYCPHCFDGDEHSPSECDV